MKVTLVNLNRKLLTNQQEAHVIFRLWSSVSRFGWQVLPLARVNVQLEQAPADEETETMVIETKQYRSQQRLFASANLAASLISFLAGLVFGARA